MTARPFLVLGLALAVASGTALLSKSCAAVSPQDGSAGAPSGFAPAYPNLFAPYKVRPSWPVADVDYPVGNPEHGKGKDWRTPGALPACVSVISTYDPATGAPNMLGLNGPRCTLIGFNFCANNGVGFYGNNVAVDMERDDFCALPGGPSSGNDLVTLQGASSLTLRDIDFNGEGTRGAGSTTQAGLLLFVATGALTVEYVRAYNVGSHVFDLGERSNNANSATWFIAYNSGLNTGMAATTHGEIDYFCGGHVSNVHIIGNTGIEQVGLPHLSNAAPFTMVGDSGCSAPATISNSEVGWNVSIVQGSPGEVPGSGSDSSVAAAAAFFVTGNLTRVSLHDNFLDWTGAFFPFYLVPNTDSGANTVSNNVDLTTGRVCSEVTPSSAGAPWWSC